jgi:glyoxylase-like metal-dependent hydrolase (beta-lactamase superfamily II)
MKRTAITPEITQLTRLALVNAYLVAESDGMTLVDTMLPGSAKAILDVVKIMGLPLRRILLTHAHGDHVGSVDALARTLPGVEIAIGRRESRLLARDFSLDADEPKNKLGGMFPKVGARPSVLLAEGDRYGSLIAIATPGHTPGHLAFLDERSGTMIAGDALVSVGGLRVVSDASWVFPLAKIATWHAPTALASARKLAVLTPRIILVGHGQPVAENAAQQLRDAVRHAEEESNSASAG